MVFATAPDRTFSYWTSAMKVDYGRWWFSWN